MINSNDNLNILLNEELITLYWIGFILADGYFCKNKASNGTEYIRFGIELAEKDKCHLLQLLTYLNFDESKLKTRIRKGGYRQFTINWVCKEIIPKIMKKYELNFNKSYNPPNINVYKKFTDDQMFSLIAGFIDGDASIVPCKTSNNIRLSFENHASYKEFFEFIQTFLFYRLKYPNHKETYIRENNRGYVCMCFSNKDFLLSLKNKLYELNLPLLKRKWENIQIQSPKTPMLVIPVL